MDEKSIFTEIINPEEKVIWTGKPVVAAAWGDFLPATYNNWTRMVIGIITSGFFLFVFIFTLLVGIASLVDFANRESFNLITAIIFIFITLVFIWIEFKFGVYVLLPFLSIYRAKNRYYALTNRRTIIATKSRNGFHFESFDLSEMEDPGLARLRKNGIGDIVFIRYSAFQPGEEGSDEYYTHFDDGFTAIESAEIVLSLINESRNNKKN